MNYPKREPFFAHKFVRLLTKSCAAQDIGLNAFALLCVIAHQEDSARYSGPVRFWNEQLMNVLGFKSPKQLNDCRAKAIQFGWLGYERSGNREVGRYAVIVPEGFEGLDDSPIESIRSVNHSESGTNKERIAERLGDESRNESVTESGKPSVPSPVPVPSIYTPGPDVTVPDKLNTEQFREVVSRWIDYTRRSTNEANAIESNSMEEQELWRLIAAWGVDAETLSAAVGAAILGRWANLRKPSGSRYDKTEKGKSRYSDDLMAALKVCKSHPGRDSWQEREKHLTQDQIRALKRAGGSTALLEAAGNDWNLQTFAEIYEAHLKEIRNGITASN
jgi:hypothetical protein